MADQAACSLQILVAFVVSMAIVDLFDVVAVKNADGKIKMLAMIDPFLQQLYVIRKGAFIPHGGKRVNKYAFVQRIDQTFLFKDFSLRSNVPEQEQQNAREISREMAELQKSKTALEEELQQREQEISQLEEEAEGLRRRLNSRELVLENSLVLTLSITEGAAIRLEKSPEGKDVIPYDWENDNYAYNRLRSLLSAAKP